MENKLSKLSIQIPEIDLPNNSLKSQIDQIKEEIQLLIINNYQNKFQSQNIIDKITLIISILFELFNKKFQIILNKYESILRRDEQTIRILYKSLLTHKLLKDSLDNKIRLLLIKEKEYELIKEKTGAYVKNGEIFYNKQKDNEIIILRTENSNLKTILENFEKIISEKGLLYENLKKQYYNLEKKLNKINKNTSKKLCVPNINISLNEPPNMAYINNNVNHCSSNLHNNNHNKKPYNNSYNKNEKNFNYIKYKNISKINKNIPFNNSISSKNLFQNSVFDLSPRDIFDIKKNSSKSKSNEKSKKFSFYNQKDICSLKKKKCKIDEAFNYNFKKNQFNLLQSYTANSSKNMHKSPSSKKLSAYSNDVVKISNYHNKNNHSKKINFSNKKTKKIINGDSIETQIFHKSYISNIPFNKEKCNNIRVRKEGTNIKKYQLNYCKTKRENNSKNLYNKKNNYKEFNNIDTNKIFLPSSVKKNRKKPRNEI